MNIFPKADIKYEELSPQKGAKQFDEAGYAKPMGIAKMSSETIMPHLDSERG